LLTDSLVNTHLKFCGKFPEITISYALFCRLRPFWVVPPIEHDRETCICKVHENPQFTVDKLQSMGILRKVTIETLCSSIVCSSQEKTCMYGLCQVCKDSKIEFQCSHSADGNDTASCGECCNILKPKLSRFDQNEVVWCHRWTSKTDFSCNREGTGVFNNIDLVDNFHSYLSKIRRHIVNIRHQYQQYRLTKCVVLSER